MRRYALVLLLIAACTHDPYVRAAACEEIVEEASLCEYQKQARLALAVEEFWKDPLALQRECHSQETRECELFLKDFRAGRVK